MIPFPVFVGYDDRERVASSVLAHSLHKHSPIPLAITFLSRRTLAPVFSRQRLRNEATDFSFSRFLVPYLCDYRGWALWLDCDMLVRHDLRDLLKLCNLHSAWQRTVWVVKHDYTPKSKTKFLRQVNEAYPRKNWSSLMLFNCDRCRALTPERVNTASGEELHQFLWCPDDQIGSLDPRWNHLVGEYEPRGDDVWNYHWTLGGPWFDDYADSEGAGEWFAAYSEMVRADQVQLADAAE